MRLRTFGLCLALAACGGDPKPKARAIAPEEIQPASGRLPGSAEDTRSGQAQAAPDADASPGPRDAGPATREPDAAGPPELPPEQADAGLGLEGVDASVPELDARIGVPLEPR